MTCDEWLCQATAQLTRAGVGTARLDALVLLEDVTEHDRGWLLAHPEFEIVSSQLTRLTKLLNQRAKHVPLAYVRGRTEFYGREFVITPAVLEPRPESETMIELLKAWTQDPSLKPNKRQKLKIADVGTGCGALGITAALEVPNTDVELLDIDRTALKVAKTNVDKFTLSMSVVQSDLLANAKHAYDVLLCNMPYVPDSYPINRAAAFEPELAIFGGPDGLDLYRQLFDQISKLPKQPLYILTEALPAQHPELAAIAQLAGFKVHQIDDFIQGFVKL